MAAQALQDEPQEQTQNATPNVSQQQPISRPKRNLALTTALVLLFLLMASGMAYFSYQNYQLKSQVARLERDIVLETDAPAIEEQVQENNTYTFQNFSIRYPEDWKLMEMSKSEDFPLKKRISSVNSSVEALALEKDGIYLIVHIGVHDTGGVGGIFLSDFDFEEFIADKDKLQIDGSTFYLTRFHHDLDSLAESHSGPWGWGSLIEFIPNKQEVSGEFVDGYESVVIRDNYAYNFFVAGEEEGVNSAELQKELVSILETADW